MTWLQLERSKRELFMFCPLGVFQIFFSGVLLLFGTLGVFSNSFYWEYVFAPWVYFLNSFLLGVFLIFVLLGLFFNSFSWEYFLFEVFFAPLGVCIFLVGASKLLLNCCSLSSGIFVFSQTLTSNML